MDRIHTINEARIKEAATERTRTKVDQAKSVAKSQQERDREKMEKMMRRRWERDQGHSR